MATDPKANPGKTHYEGDDCPGGHRVDPKATEQKVRVTVKCWFSDGHLSVARGEIEKGILTVFDHAGMQKYQVVHAD